MKQFFREFISNRDRHTVMIHVYMLLTVLSSVLFFLGVRDIYALFGNHCVVYPILGIVISTQLQSFDLLAVSMLYWGISVTTLLISYLFAVTKRKYLALMIVSFADVLFSVWMVYLSVSVGGYDSFHLLQIIGAVVNLVYSIYFLWLYRKEAAAA